MSLVAAWIGVVIGAGIGAWCVYYYSQRAVARRAGRRLSEALSICHAVFTALDHVPNSLISRDLRRGLVLMIDHHLGVMREIQPRHPHLWDLQRRLEKLNRMPTGLKRSTIRNRTDRRHATLALEELARLLKAAVQAQALNQKTADLAAAAAKFASQQVAVESARQAAKDAENMRAYRHALNFAYQASALCRKLPPLMGKALSEAVAADVERLESLLGRTART